MERLTRFAADAPPEERREFAIALMRALDRLGVPPGGEFVVTEVAGEPHTRRTDPDTSRSAAASIENLKTNQEAVLRVFTRERRPMTDEALIEAYARLHADHFVPAQSPSGIRSRRSELARGGLLIDTGEKAVLSSGRQAILWALPERLLPDTNGVPALFGASRP